MAWSARHAPGRTANGVAGAPCCIQAACRLWGNPNVRSSGLGYGRRMPTRGLAPQVRLLRRTHWPLRCVYCEEPVGVDEPVYVIDGEGKAVAANAAELHAEPYRYRSRVLHRSCAEDAGFAAPG